MTPTAFLRTVLLLYGDHWQQPCQALVAGCGRASAKDFHEIWAVFTRGVA